MNGQGLTHIHFLLLPGYAELSLSSALETLQCCNAQIPGAQYRWTIGSPSNEDVTSSVGTVFPASLLSPVPHDVDVLAVVSGLNVEKWCCSKTLAILRHAHRSGAVLLGFSTGAYALAKAGLMNGKTATINWKYRNSFSEIFPDVEIVKTLCAVDGKIGTTAGGVAAIDLILHLISQDHGESLATNVAHHMSYSPIRALNRKLDVSSPNRMSVWHPRLEKVIRLMEENIEEPLSIPEIASTVAVSIRQLERLFKRQLNTSPKRYYTELRLANARMLLIQTDMSVTEIAMATGFSSVNLFSKWYRSAYGTKPSLVRSGISEP